MAKFVSPERRIDVTLQGISDFVGSMSQHDLAKVVSKPWWESIVAVTCLRSMERAEEEGLGRPAQGLADIYDQIVSPGDHAADALVRTYHAMLTEVEPA
jgi:hypothetical protein